MDEPVFDRRLFKENIFKSFQLSLICERELKLALRKFHRRYI